MGPARTGFCPTVESILDVGPRASRRSQMQISTNTTDNLAIIVNE